MTLTTDPDLQPDRRSSVVRQTVVLKKGTNDRSIDRDLLMSQGSMTEKKSGFGDRRMSHAEDFL